jgi:hypothetical protein
MNNSPIEQFLALLDSLDPGAATSLMAPGARLLVMDGRRVEGKDEAGALLADFVATLRSTRHRITEQWHIDDVWIAEVLADYVLQDWLELKALPRAMVVRVAPEGITDIRVYGASEHPLTEGPTGDGGTWVGGRWVPPL